MLIPNKISENKIKEFFIKMGLEKTLFSKSNKKENVYPPNIKDLYFLFKIITLNKRIRLLEFGTGYSTLVMSLALKFNYIKYKNIKFEELGISSPFSFNVIDDQKKYLEISKRRVEAFPQKNLIKPVFKYSKCSLTKFNGIYCNEYDSLPNTIPDFIYLDGPDINEINNSINGIKLSSGQKYPPLSCDILKIEYFFNPGTIILVDGRSANCLFLKNNLQRNWTHKYNNYNDQHYFFLNEQTNGVKSKKLISFYSS